MSDQPESFREQLSRVEMMAEDDGETWDLSHNDRAALKAVLASARGAVQSDSRSLKENSDARSELRDTSGTPASGFSTQETPERPPADDVAELDRQISDYKTRCDRGETVSDSDARWLLNELIYERDQARGAVHSVPDTKAEVMPSDSLRRMHLRRDELDDSVPGASVTI